MGPTANEPFGFMHQFHDGRRAWISTEPDGRWKRIVRSRPALPTVSPVAGALERKLYLDRCARGFGPR